MLAAQKPTGRANAPRLLFLPWRRSNTALQLAGRAALSHCGHRGHDITQLATAKQRLTETQRLEPLKYPRRIGVCNPGNTDAQTAADGK